MKKNILTAVIALLLPLAAFAIPAKPGRITYTQPDGTTIGIYIHGDEWFHWVTDENGNYLEADEEGYYRIASSAKSTATKARIEAGIRNAAEVRARVNADRRRAAAQSLNFGAPKIPVLLIGFKDKKFTKSASDFENMLNQEGYSVNGSIGSVRDFYRENSLGVFSPEFVVLGPVNLDNNISTYGANVSGQAGYDTAPEQALVDAAKKLDSTVDFSQFDNDGDGVVDFVLFYYAGFDEAQGGSSSSIWSHSFELHHSYDAEEVTFDGVVLEKYFCTSELVGSSGTTMCNIGTTCHEFGHALGLPDYYDTDYDVNSTPNDMYSYSTMCSGSYNNNSTTPPYFTAEELITLGWYDAPEYIMDNGPITLQALNKPGASEYHGYRTDTYNRDEYFMYEVRSGQRWDAGLRPGMIVYHVDKSQNRVFGQVTAASTWEDNTLNSWGVHPCCYLIPATDQDNLQFGLTYFSSAGQWVFNYDYEYKGTGHDYRQDFVFPNTGVTSYAPTAWDGDTFGYSFSNITYSSADYTVTMNVTDTNGFSIRGVITDSDGNPLSGALVSVTSASESFSATGVSSIYHKPLRKNAASVIASVVTEEDGVYSFALAEGGDYAVTAERSSFIGRTKEIFVSTDVTLDIALLRMGEVDPYSINPLGDYDSGYYYYATSNSWIIQNRYRTTEMSKHAGKRINSVSFYLEGEGSTTFGGVYGIVDFGNTRVATVQMDKDDVTPGGWNTVDLRSLNLLVPENEDIYAGCAVNNWGYKDGSYYYITVYGESVDGNAFDGYTASYNLTSTGTRNKHTSSNYSGGTAFWIYITVGDMPPVEFGYNYIDDPNEGAYAAGDRFALNLIEAEGTRKPAGDVAWYYDDEPVAADSITLTSGHHLIEARFTTQAGKAKVVELEIDVQ